MSEPKSEAGDPRTDVNELVGLVKTYAVQETVGPLKQVGQVLAYGSAAAVMFGFASFLTLLAVLRLLQGETGTVFAGEWDWVPYVITMFTAVLMLAAGAYIGLRSQGSELQ